MVRFDRIIGLEPSAVILTVSLAVLVHACVGREGSSSSTQESSGYASERSLVRESATAEWDSVATLSYRMFDRTPWPGDSSRLLTRFVVMRTAEYAGSDALAKTLMTVLDSIGGADTSLVAVRGILYTARPTAPGRANLVPTVWGEWVPPGGWEMEPSQGSRQTHRTFVYHLDPGWQLPEPTGAGEVERD